MILKKFLRTTGFIVFISVFFFSCSVQKRRYLKGFHVEFSASKHKNSTKKTDKEVLEHTPLAKQQLMRADSMHHVAPSHPTSIAHKETRQPNDRKLIKQESATDMLFGRSQSKSNQKLTHEKERYIKKSTVEDEKSTPEKTQRRMAVLTGVSLLLMALVAAFTVPLLGELFVVGDSVLTALNVTSQFSKYIRSVSGWLGILLLDVLVSLGIYRYYKKEKPKLAGITAVLRLLYSAILGIGIAQLLSVTKSSPGFAIYKHIDLFHKFWGIGLIVFGCHLIALGVLYHNEGGKKWLNITIKTLLIVAGIGYIILYTGILIVPNPVGFAAFVEPLFLIPMVLGEITYALWKIIKGGRSTKKAAKQASFQAK